jgi:glycosyltransferase involved in cell wall biosynthesis
MDKEKFSPYLIIPSEGRLCKEAQQLGVHIDYLSVPKLRLKNLVRIIEVILTIRRYILDNRIDILHSYTPRNNILGAIAAELCKIPVIWHERNMIYGQEMDISKTFMFLPDAIICNSRATAERFKTRKGIPDKVRVILNGVNTSEFHPGSPSQAVLKKYNLKGEKVIGLISNFTKRKKPEYLLFAGPLILRQIPDIRFMVVGDDFTEADKGRHSELVSTVKRLDIEDRVIFTGFVSDVSDIIQTFDIGVAVTEKEACSRAILEIMASGKPVVAFNTGGNPELIEHGTTGILVNFGNTESLANSIVELLVNEKKRKKMGLRAAERIRQFFDAELNAEQTVELYSELLKRNTKPLP